MAEQSFEKKVMGAILGLNSLVLSWALITLIDLNTDKAVKDSVITDIKKDIQKGEEKDKEQDENFVKIWAVLNRDEGIRISEGNEQKKPKH